MNEVQKEVLKDFINNYYDLIGKLGDQVEKNSFMKNKILFQNYQHDFSNFIKNNLEESERDRYLRKLDNFSQMIHYFFLIPNHPMFKIMLMDDVENPKNPKYGKLLRVIEETTAFFDIELERLNKSKIEFVVANEIKKVEKLVMLKKAFIVHGHDDKTKYEVARFLEKLDFEVVILHEQASGGKTIIEKLEQYTDVGFAIVLYTPDDEGSVKDKKNYMPRARQNVVFEHGLLVGKLGREKVFPLVTDNTVELPGDISGMVYLSDTNWELKLAKEIRELGYQIDMNKVV